MNTIAIKSPLMESLDKKLKDFSNYGTYLQTELAHPTKKVDFVYLEEKSRDISLFKNRLEYTIRSMRDEMQLSGFQKAQIVANLNPWAAYVNDKVKTCKAALQKLETELNSRIELMLKLSNRTSNPKLFHDHSDPYHADYDSEEVNEETFAREHIQSFSRPQAEVKIDLITFPADPDSQVQVDLITFPADPDPEVDLITFDPDPQVDLITFETDPEVDLITFDIDTQPSWPRKIPIKNRRTKSLPQNLFLYPKPSEELEDQDIKANTDESKEETEDIKANTDESSKPISSSMRRRRRKAKQPTRESNKSSEETNPESSPKTVIKPKRIVIKNQSASSSENHIEHLFALQTDQSEDQETFANRRHRFVYLKNRVGENQARFCTNKKPR